jgi:hypothetical protein
MFEVFKPRFVHFKRSFRHTRSPTVIWVPYVSLCRHKPPDPCKYARVSALHASMRAQRRAARVGPPPPPTANFDLPLIFRCFHRSSILLQRRVVIIRRQAFDEPLASVVEFFVFWCVFLVLLCSLLCFF